jgi:hypothetical protein
MHQLVNLPPRPGARRPGRGLRALALSGLLLAVAGAATLAGLPTAEATPRGGKKGGGKATTKATGKAKGGAKASKPDEDAGEGAGSATGAPDAPKPDGESTGGAAAATPTTPTTPTTTPATTPTSSGGTAGGGPAATPTPAAGDATQPAEVPEPAAGDVDALRQEYLSLRDELFKSRARAAAVASQLYSTKITIKLTYTSGRYYGVGKALVRLDGANVYEDATGAISTDDGIRFEGFLAPGRHLITFRVEATGKDDDRFSSATESQIVVQAVANKDLLVAAKARDGGDIAYEWQRKERGSYGLGLDVAVKTTPHADGGDGKAAPAPGKKGK